MIVVGEDMAAFSIADLLPQPPWMGPPLPRFLGILWPWVSDEGSLQLPNLPPHVGFGHLPETLYENVEEITWTDRRGRERRATIKRKATKR